MPVNHLEQLVAEWLEYQGYFVRRNLKVGPRKNGGYECELDVVAFNPESKHLVQYEPSTDTDPWSKRERRFQKKFDAGRRYIPYLFTGIEIPNRIDQVAVFLYGSDENQKTVGGGRVVPVHAFLREVANTLAGKRIAKAIVPEQFALLRVLHLACEYRDRIFSWNGDARAPALRREQHGKNVQRLPVRGQVWD